MRKKIISIFLLICILLYSSCTFLNTPVYASAGGGEKVFTRESAVRIAQGIAALYLLHTVNNLINNNKNNNSDHQEDLNINSQLFSEKVIVIDPGHGGYDPGAVGPSGLKEKDVNLEIALKLYDLIRRQKETSVYLTRNKDIFVPLKKRTAMANKLDADIFVSIHCNADKKGIERGTETYAHYNTSSETWALAWNLQDSLVQELKLKDRGLKADNFHVIRETNDMKAILLEIAYISNYREEALLKDKQTTDKVAMAIYKGIINYYGS